MKALFIECPSREKNESLPFGLLYAASAFERLGNEVQIIDLSNEDWDFIKLCKGIDNYQPEIICFGGITPSYRRLKNISVPLKEKYKDIPFIVGGVISSIAELLIESAKIDIVVKGEAEIVFPSLLAAIKNKDSLNNIRGIVFKAGERIIVTTKPQQVDDLDTIPIPNYELVNMPTYLMPVEKWISQFFNEEEGRAIKVRLKTANYILPIITARGCTHACVFCYRHMRGIRQHSVDYIVNHILYLKNKYGVGIFQINDELTTSNRQWVLDFCSKVIEQKLEIFFIVLSGRVDNVDEEMLTALKAAGCLMINYGYETGSVKIIKEIHKGVTIDQSLKTALLTKKMGLKNIPEIMIGFPGETPDTVKETISFLKAINTWPISMNFPLPFPQTPLWNEAKKKGLIPNDEEFILGYDNASNFTLNLTDYPDNEVKSWFDNILYSVHLHYLFTHHKYKDWLIIKCISLINKVPKLMSVLRRLKRILGR